MPWTVDEANAVVSTAIATWWLVLVTTIAAAATLGAVIAAFKVQARQFEHEQAAKDAEELRRSRAGWVAVNQSLEVLRVLLGVVRDNGAATPVQWGYLRVGTRAAVAAANEALRQEIPNLDLLNLAIHAQTLAHSFNEDLERRAVESPGLTGEGYINAILKLEESLAEQEAVAKNLKTQLEIDL